MLLPRHQLPKLHQHLLPVVAAVVVTMATKEVSRLHRILQ